MELLNQFQGFIGSIGFGFFFNMFFHLIYKIIKKQIIFIKFPICLSIFLFGTYKYYLFLINYTYGIMNIFYPLSIFIGFVFYQFFYYPKFNMFYNRLIMKTQTLIKLKYNKWFDIIMKKKERNKDVKAIKSEKQNG